MPPRYGKIEPETAIRCKCRGLPFKPPPDPLASARQHWFRSLLLPLGRVLPENVRRQAAHRSARFQLVQSERRGPAGQASIPPTLADGAEHFRNRPIAALVKIDQEWPLIRNRHQQQWKALEEQLPFAQDRAPASERPDIPGKIH